MSEFMIYPCTKSGKILRGFCPTVCTSMSDVVETLRGWIRFSSKFGIKYWYCGLNNKVTSLGL